MKFPAIAVLQQHAGGRTHHVASRKINMWIGGVRLQRHGRKFPMFQAQYGLDQPGHAGGRFKMAYIGLDGTDGHRPSAATPKDPSDGIHFYWVPHGSAGAMSFDEVDVIHTQTALLKHRPHQFLLSVGTGNGQTGLAGPIGIDPGGKDDRLDGIAIPHGCVQRLKQQCRTALGTHISIGGSVKRAALPLGRQHGRVAEAYKGIGVHEQVHAAD